jgi:hypothetical protein
VAPCKPVPQPLGLLENERAAYPSMARTLRAMNMRRGAEVAKDSVRRRPEARARGDQREWKFGSCSRAAGYPSIEGQVYPVVRQPPAERDHPPRGVKAREVRALKPGCRVNAPHALNRPKGQQMGATLIAVVELPRVSVCGQPPKPAVGQTIRHRVRYDDGSEMEWAAGTVLPALGAKQRKPGQPPARR